MNKEQIGYVEKNTKIVNLSPAMLLIKFNGLKISA